MLINRAVRHEINVFYTDDIKEKNMKEIWNGIQIVCAAIGGWLAYYLGGFDGILYALIAFVVVDYIEQAQNI